MSEKFPSSAVSHAELDKDLYGVDMTESALLEARAEAAAANRDTQERNQALYERQRQERVAGEMATGAIRAYEATRYDDQYARQAAEREQAETEEGAMRAYVAREAGHTMDPTAAFREKQAEYEAMDRVYEDAGKVDTLNSAFAREVEKVTDEDGGIDVDKLNPNDLIRYKAALDPLVGEDAQSYEKRMESVFGTKNHIDTIAKLVDEGDAWRLKDIAKRNPGANPLADALLRYTESQQESEE